MTQSPEAHCLGLHGSSVVVSGPASLLIFGSIILSTVLIPKVIWCSKKHCCSFICRNCSPERQGAQEVPASWDCSKGLSWKPTYWFWFIAHWPPLLQEGLGNWAGDLFCFVLFRFEVEHMADPNNPSVLCLRRHGMMDTGQATSGFHHSNLPLEDSRKSRLWDMVTFAVMLRGSIYKTSPWDRIDLLLITCLFSFIHRSITLGWRQINQPFQQPVEW